MDPTPTVTLHVPGPLRAYCGGASQLTLSAPTVRAALEELERSHPPCTATSATRRGPCAAT